tara:strand:- start:88 stop:783 length:696 start_codon:yes stop_codon:yes gene_type:complete
MCGRYALFTDPRTIRNEFDLVASPNLPPKYNVSPTQDSAVVWMSEDTGIELSLMRWGLVPSWAKSIKYLSGPIINVRGETASKHPISRESFAARRCLVPTDGFYEWKVVGAKKRPYYISLSDKRLFAFAGVWDFWRSPDGDLLRSFAIITVTATQKISPIHARMPLLIDHTQYKYWLSADEKQPNFDILRSLPPPVELEAYEVSCRVNSYSNDDARCIEPLPCLRYEVERI